MSHRMSTWTIKTRCGIIARLRTRRRNRRFHSPLRAQTHVDAANPLRNWDATRRTPGCATHFEKPSTPRFERDGVPDRRPVFFRNRAQGVTQDQTYDTNLFYLVLLLKNAYRGFTHSFINVKTLCCVILDLNFFDYHFYRRYAPLRD